MSVDNPSPPAATTESWPLLDMLERRVLGVLAEKQKTTPDVYPMSLNALTNGCNQKSNRDPILSLEEEQVEEVLVRLQKKGLTIRITGSRVEKWRQTLYEQWKLTRAEMALLIELLLRGPQTEGELRSRVSRMEPFDDLDAMRAVLKPMAERKLVVYLTPEGRRGTMLTHGFHEARELERLRAAAPVDLPEAPASPVPVAPAPARVDTSHLEARIQELTDDLTSLRGTVTDLQALVTTLAEKVREVREGLGL